MDLLRTDGFEADQLDPLTDDLADPQRSDTPYDGVWICACLIHVAREDLGTVLGRLADATRHGGRLHASLREGDGENATRDLAAIAQPGPRADVKAFRRSVEDVCRRAPG